jgi:hypothetical protein
VAVGHVMHDLANSPAAGAIGRVELVRRQTCDGSSKLRRRIGNLFNCALDVLG